MTKRIAKRIGFIVAVIVLLLIIAASCCIIWYKSNISAIVGVACANSHECETITVKIDEGSSATTIADKLEQSKVIKSALAFRIYLMIEAPNKTLLPGEYSFRQDMSVEKIVESLNKGVVAKTFRVTFLPGETLRATRKKLIEVGYAESDVDEALSQQYSHELLASKPASASLEGYIWGDTYEFYDGTPLADVLKTVFDEMLKVVKSENLIEKYQARGLTLHQGITLASIIQREAPASYDEKRHIAQVFLTRLSKNIVLGSDAIIAYQADQINPYRDKGDMSYLNSIGCPWNSRRCQGLPPTPISAPGKDSLKSVADPTATSDLYFLTGDDGNMYYATAEAGHQQNIKNYCKELCKVL